MPCKHKFFKDLLLDQITFEPTKLIIGTFNPCWEGIDNYAEWFYGRTSNNYFWYVMPKAFSDEDLHDKGSKDWKDYCERQGIAITDLISTIEDASEEDENHRLIIKGYKDSDIIRFKSFSFTPIVKILEKHKTIKDVYLTRSSDSNGFWDLCWKEIADYCDINGVNCTMLLTPSKEARFQMTKGTNLKLKDFILDRWLQKIYF